MNTYLLIASILAVIIGVVHSFLGEKLIFSKLRSGGVVPTQAPSPLKERNLRIIWATWHIVSVLGFSVAVLLYWLAMPSTSIVMSLFLKAAIGVPMLLVSIFVFIS